MSQDIVEPLRVGVDVTYDRQIYKFARRLVNDGLDVLVCLGSVEGCLFERVPFIVYASKASGKGVESIV